MYVYVVIFCPLGYAVQYPEFDTMWFSKQFQLPIIDAGVGVLLSSSFLQEDKMIETTKNV